MSNILLLVMKSLTKIALITLFATYLAMKGYCWTNSQLASNLVLKGLPHTDAPYSADVTGLGDVINADVGGDDQH